MKLLLQTNVADAYTMGRLSRVAKALAKGLIGKYIGDHVRYRYDQKNKEIFNQL